MGKRSRIKRHRDNSDEDEELVPTEVMGVSAAETAAASVAQDVLQADDGDNDDGEAENAASETPATPVQESKRKRAPVTTPNTAQEEVELARRRRRRQSLVFQKRRQSLTPSKSTTSSGDADPPNRQYISDMYSTIIKMSSENKINIKNTWSLHLIDHMEDILSSPQKERPGVVAEDTNTFNFQKASCTLDASVKIYSYRVDDTWTSSYKILENLSRSGGEKRADHDDGEGEGEDDDVGGDDGEASTQRRGKKKGSARKTANAAKSIEKNLNNITLKSYELDFEPDPLFHKMSQTFDEGGAKGMLLANLSVYDGAKILLNSADVKLSTRKSMLKKDTEDANGDEETPAKPSTKISLATLGKLSCFSKDVMSLAVCPPLKRLYDQIDELRDPSMTQSKVNLRDSVLTFAPRRREHAYDDPFVPSTPAAQNDFVPTSTTEDGDATMEDATDQPPVDELERVDSTNDFGRGNDDEDDDGDENEPDDQGFDFGGGDEMDVEMEDADAPTGTPVGESVDRSEEAQVATEDAVDGDGDPSVDVDADANDPVTERHVDPVTDSSNEPKPVVIKSAADYFRSQMQDDDVKNEHDIAYSQLIETALMRSVVLEADGAAEKEQNDYSYFDAKILKNWAGPSHWKSKGTRKIPASMLAFIEEVDGVVQQNTKAKRGRKPQPKKTNTITAEKRSLVVDFFGDVPDLAKLLKAPRVAADNAMSKLVVRKQLQKSADLVFPVDAHIEPKIFFRHFMKPRLQLFHRRVQLASGGAALENSYLPATSDPALADTDNLAYEDGGNYGGHDFGGGGYSDDDDDDDSDNEPDREGSSAFFSSANLITAERVVEKIDVQYERVAKRVDVKKLKTSIWSHLEAGTGVAGKRSSRHKDKNDTDDQQPEPESAEDEFGDDEGLPPTTSFDSVVHGISGKVPPNVTVSFYFICMLHLANEKGLRLTGQDDLSNFEIKKEEPLVRD